MIGVFKKIIKMSHFKVISFLTLFFAISCNASPKKNPELASYNSVNEESLDVFDKISRFLRDDYKFHEQKTKEAIRRLNPNLKNEKILLAPKLNWDSMTLRYNKYGRLKKCPSGTRRDSKGNCRPLWK